MSSLTLNRGFSQDKTSSSSNLETISRYIQFKRYQGTKYFMLETTEKTRGYLRSNLFSVSHEKINPTNSLFKDPGFNDSVKIFAQSKIDEQKTCNSRFKRLNAEIFATGGMTLFEREFEKFQNYMKRHALFNKTEVDEQLFPKFFGKAIVMGANNPEIVKIAAEKETRVKEIADMYRGFHPLSRNINNSLKTTSFYYPDFCAAMYEKITELKAMIEFIEKFLKENFYNILVEQKDTPTVPEKSICEEKGVINILKLTKKENLYLKFVRSSEDVSGFSFDNYKAFLSECISAFEFVGEMLYRNNIVMGLHDRENSESGVSALGAIYKKQGHKERVYANISTKIAFITNEVIKLGLPAIWEQPFYEVQAVESYRKLEFPEFPSPNAIQKLNDLNELIVCSEHIKLIRAVHDPELIYTSDYRVSIPQGKMLNYAFFKENNEVYTMIDTTSGICGTVRIFSSQDDEIRLYKKDMSLPDLYLIDQFNLVSLFKEYKYFFETEISRTTNRMINSINVKKYKGSEKSIPPMPSKNLRGRLENLLFHSFDFRERRRGKMYAIVYETAESKSLIAFDSVNMYNLTRPSEGAPLDEYTRQALLYAANITKIDTNVEIYTGRDRARSIHSPDFFMTVSVVEPNSIFYKPVDLLPYDVKIISSNVFPYLPIIGLHHKQMTMSQNSSNETKVSYRDRVWMRKFSSANEIDEYEYDSVEVNDTDKERIKDSRHVDSKLVFSSPLQYAIDILTGDNKNSIKDIARKLSTLERISWNGYDINLSRNLITDLLLHFKSPYLSILMVDLNIQLNSKNMEACSKILKAISSTIYSKLSSHYFDGERFSDFTYIMNRPSYTRHEFKRTVLSSEKNPPSNIHEFSRTISGTTFKFAKIDKVSDVFTFEVGQIINDIVNFHSYSENFFGDFITFTKEANYSSFVVSNPDLKIHHEKDGRVFVQADFSTLRRKKIIKNFASPNPRSGKYTLNQNDYDNRKTYLTTIETYNKNTDMTLQEIIRIFKTRERDVVELDNKKKKRTGTKKSDDQSDTEEVDTKKSLKELGLDLDHDFWGFEIDENTSISRVLTIRESDQNDFDRMVAYVRDNKSLPLSMNAFVNSDKKASLNDTVLRESLIVRFLKLKNLGEGKSLSPQNLNQDLYQRIGESGYYSNLVDHMKYSTVSSSEINVTFGNNDVTIIDNLSGLEVTIPKIMVEATPVKIVASDHFDPEFSGNIPSLNLKILSYIDDILGKDIISKMIKMTKEENIIPSQIGNFLYSELATVTNPEKMKRLLSLFNSLKITVNSIQTKLVEKPRTEIDDSSLVYRSVPDALMNVM